MQTLPLGSMSIRSTPSTGEVGEAEEKGPLTGEVGEAEKGTLCKGFKMPLTNQLSTSGNLRGSASSCLCLSFSPPLLYLESVPISLFSNSLHTYLKMLLL